MKVEFVTNLKRQATKILAEIHLSITNSIKFVRCSGLNVGRL